MKRIKIEPNMIADYDTLVKAAVTAARGKRLRPDVGSFFSKFDENIEMLREDLLSRKAPYNRYRSFTLFDPKQRRITAVCFEDRVIHHALMGFAAPVLEKAMIHDTFACREGKGPLQAVYKAQRNIQKYPWYVKIDIRKYFETIDHKILFALLERKFKGGYFHDLVRRIVRGYSIGPGKGLPIGSLTSQHFANYYLDGLDRFIVEKTPALGYVRYMDDMVWWCGDKGTAKKILAQAREYAEEKRLLRIKDNEQIQRSIAGITFCGFRILPGTIRLTKRRKQRYTARRKYWENCYATGKISALQLQRAYDSVKGIVAHSRATGWLKKQLWLHPCPDA